MDPGGPGAQLCCSSVFVGLASMAQYIGHAMPFTQQSYRGLVPNQCPFNDADEFTVSGLVPYRNVKRMVPHSGVVWDISRWDSLVSHGYTSSI